MRRLFSLAALVIAFALPVSADAKDKLAVVTSFSILEDMVARVGGDHVTVKALVAANGDAHAFSPTPGDVKALGGADLFVINGLGFEGWADKLPKSAGFKGVTVVVSKGVEPLKGEAEDEHGHGGAHEHGHDHDHDHGDTDPHAWQDLANGLIYVANIRDALAAADTAHAADYSANAERYSAELRELDAWVKGEIGKVPAAKRKVITAHDAFGYFGRAYGVEFIAAKGVSTDSEPSAKAIARIVDQIRKERITALFLENMSDKRLIEQLQRDGGATIGGTVYSDALSEADGPAANYVAMFKRNVGQLVPAMLGNPGS